MAGPTAHDDRVQREFTRQAESFAASATLGGDALIGRLVEALGPVASGRVLDLAAGPGLVSEALAPRAREVVALDLTAETLRVAGRRFAAAGHDNVRRVRANGLRLPFGDARFDAVVIRLALHHLEAPQKAIGEAQRVLRPGGRLAVLDLLAPEDEADDRLLAALERLRDPSHVRTLGEDELASLLMGSGFALRERAAFGLERRFSEWARIIADPARTDALRVVMGALARQGTRAGVGLREDGDELVFDYRFGLVVGERP